MFLGSICECYGLYFLQLLLAESSILTFYHFILFLIQVLAYIKKNSFCFFLGSNCIQFFITILCVTDANDIL